MKLTASNIREEQLRRKLQLYLGSQQDWLPAYRGWCAENAVDDGQIHDDHSVSLFVKNQKGNHDTRRRNQSLRG